MLVVHKTNFHVRSCSPQPRHHDLGPECRRLFEAVDAQPEAADQNTFTETELREHLKQYGKGVADVDKDDLDHLNAARYLRATDRPVNEDWSTLARMAKFANDFDVRTAMYKNVARLPNAKPTLVLRDVHKENMEAWISRYPGKHMQHQRDKQVGDGDPESIEWKARDQWRRTTHDGRQQVELDRILSRGFDFCESREDQIICLGSTRMMRCDCGRRHMGRTGRAASRLTSPPQYAGHQPRRHLEFICRAQNLKQDKRSSDLKKDILKQRPLLCVNSEGML